MYTCIIHLTKWCDRTWKYSAIQFQEIIEFHKVEFLSKFNWNKIVGQTVTQCVRPLSSILLSKTKKIPTHLNGLSQLCSVRYVLFCNQLVPVRYHLDVSVVEGPVGLREVACSIPQVASYRTHNSGTRKSHSLVLASIRAGYWPPLIFPRRGGFNLHWGGESDKYIFVSVLT